MESSVGMTCELTPTADRGSGGRNSGAAAIAWIGSPVPMGEGYGEPGHWGPPGELSLPLDDRGLLLADGLFETVLVEGGAPRLLGRHHVRWRQGADLLGMGPPPDLERVEGLAAEAVARSDIRSGALRLNWTRGSGGRGLELPDALQSGRFWLQLTACRPLFTPAAVIVSPTERRCASSLLSRIKTFAYGPAIQARRQARAAGADDALLESTAGGLSCGTAANLLLCVDGRWLTPPLASGCLPGVMRARALELGLVIEAEQPIEAAWLRDGTATAALLLNSLGCRPIATCDGVALGGCRPDQAEALWRALLG